MKSEFEKCMAGECYNCHDESFLEFKNKARKLLSQYNSLSYNEKVEKYKVLQEMFGCIGTNVSVASPFICDYGCNIHIGSNVSINIDKLFDILLYLTYFLPSKLEQVPSYYFSITS